MRREIIADRIQWKHLVKIIAVINPFFMVPQFWQIVSTGVTAGLSLPSLLILILIQGGFAIHGFFIRDNTILWSNTAATTMSFATGFAIAYFRYISG